MEELYDNKNLRKVTELDEIVYPIYRFAKIGVEDSKYICGYLIKPHGYDVIRKAEYHFINQDGTPGERVCTRICWINCKHNNITCKYCKDNITKDMGMFYEKIPDDISEELLEEERKDYLDILESIKVIESTK